MLGYRDKIRALRLNREGFTLLELLVALAIGVILIVASGSIIKSSTSFMAREGGLLQRDFREVSVLEFWREQVFAVRTRYSAIDTGNPAVTMEDSASYSFVGAERELTFVTPVSLDIRNKGLVDVHYSIEEENDKAYRLTYKEGKHTTSPRTEKTTPDGLVLLEGYDYIRFEYLKELEEKKNVWESEWAEEQNAPRALRLVLVNGEEQTTLIAPIAATYFSSYSGQ